MRRTLIAQVVLVGLIAGVSGTMPVCAAPAGVTLPQQALQNGNGKSSVIVTFRADAQLDGFDQAYQPDDRSRANPRAWNYLDRHVAGAVQDIERRHGFRADHVYSESLRGFAAKLTPAQIDMLKNNPLVESVEPDSIVVASGQTMPWGINRIDADVSSTLAGDGNGTVTNLNVYVIDTGVDTKHADLYVAQHVNFSGDIYNYDCNGHGTHVAGTIAAKDNASDVVGVAPGSAIIGVKVLGCSGSGSTSNVIKGVDWVTANAKKPAVANMSLGGPPNTTLDNAVLNSVAKGIFYAVAAGNNGANACNYSPSRIGARTNGVMTIAATNTTDQEPSWSNYGSCVDIWAPGVSILSTKLGGGTVNLSGTSMATPHVAGTAGLYLSTYPFASPAVVESIIKSTAVIPGTLSKDGRVIQVDYSGAF